jgi:hypothetical protein
MYEVNDSDTHMKVMAVGKCTRLHHYREIFLRCSAPSQAVTLKPRTSRQLNKVASIALTFIEARKCSFRVTNFKLSDEKLRVPSAQSVRKHACISVDCSQVHFSHNQPMRVYSRSSTYL